MTDFIDTLIEEGRAGLNERTLYGMMKRHGLRKEHFKETPRGRSR